MLFLFWTVNYNVNSLNCLSENEQIKPVGLFNFLVKTAMDRIQGAINK